MSTSRGEFVGQSLAATPVTVAAASLGIFCGQEASIHILGGTGYPGPKTVEAAFARGHEVTIFNRGKREKFLPFPYQNVEHLHGNCDPLLPADDERGPDKALLQPVAVSQRKGQGGGSTGVRRGASE